MVEKINAGVEGVAKVTPAPSKTKATETKPANKTAPVAKAEPRKAKLRTGQIDRNIEIGFKNNTNGTLVYQSGKTGNLYVLNNFGDEDYMTFEEVLGMKNMDRKFLDEYWLILTDVPNGEYTIEEIIEALGLEYLYNGDNDVMLDLDGFIFSKLESFKKKFSKLSANTKTNVIRRTKHLYNKGEIKDIDLLKYLSDYMGDRTLFEI